MIDSTESVEKHVLFVTGPARDRLYERFIMLFSGRADVDVVKDRRFSERRHARRGPSDGERRAGDRRSRRPEWVVPPA